MHSITDVLSVLLISQRERRTVHCNIKIVSVLCQFFALACYRQTFAITNFQHLILSNCKQGNYNYQYNMFSYRQLKLTIILLLITTPRVK